MTENEARLLLSSEIHEVVLHAKATAGKMMERATMFINRSNKTEDEYYAEIFDNVSAIIRAYALELNSTAMG